MRTAGHLGRGFTVVTTLSRSRGRTWELAERYGTPSYVYSEDTFRALEANYAEAWFQTITTEVFG